MLQINLHKKACGHRGASLTPRAFLVTVRRAPCLPPDCPMNCNPFCGISIGEKSNML